MSPVLVSYGGGTNSAALLCGMIERREPAPHAILFADTGGEKPHTYTYVEAFSAWLIERGYPAIQTIRKAGNNRTLEEDCLIRNMLPSVAYGYKTCSHKFKIEPQEKWANNDEGCRSAWKRGKKVVKLIGYDADEPERAQPFDHPKYHNRYPLIEWEWGRDECIEAIKRAGLPLPGKSACFFCPNSSPAEIRELSAAYPSLAQRALAMEAGAHLTEIKGLGRRFSWADVLAQGEMFPDIYAPPRKCDACYDGAPA